MIDAVGAQRTRSRLLADEHGDHFAPALLLDHAKAGTKFQWRRSGKFSSKCSSLRPRDVVRLRRGRPRRRVPREHYYTIRDQAPPAVAPAAAKSFCGRCVARRVEPQLRRDRYVARRRRVGRRKPP